MTATNVIINDSSLVAAGNYSLIVSGDTGITGILTVGTGSTIVLDSTFVEGARAIIPILENGSVRTKSNTGTIAAASGTPFTIDTVGISSIISADYFVNVGYGSSNHSFKLLVTHNTSSAFISTYSSLATNNSLATFSPIISSGNLVLRIVPEVNGSITYSYSRQYIYQ